MANAKEQSLIFLHVKFFSFTSHLFQNFQKKLDFPLGISTGMGYNSQIVDLIWNPTYG